jgi:hypothetical protein
LAVCVSRTHDADVLAIRLSGAILADDYVKSARPARALDAKRRISRLKPIIPCSMGG